MVSLMRTSKESAQKAFNVIMQARTSYLTPEIAGEFPQERLDFLTELRAQVYDWVAGIDKNIKSIEDRIESERDEL